MLKFVLATRNDVGQLNKLMRHSKAYWGYDRAFLDKFMETFSIKANQLDQMEFQMAYAGKRLVGFVSVRIKNPELDALFVDPDSIGKGYGKQLWDKALDIFERYGIKQFTIWSDPNAESFYKKMGAKFVKHKISPIGERRTTSIYEYTLND